MLQLLEADVMHLPVFATTDARMVLIKGGGIDHANHD